MATKKPAKSTKKPAAKKPATKAAKTTTKVTTVKAVDTKKTKPTKVSEPKGAVVAANVSPEVNQKFSFSRSPILSGSIAEFLGTFLLAGFFVVTQGSSLFVLFAIVSLVLVFGVISGAHFNPAITVGAWATRRINSSRAVSYLVAQVLGAMLALVIANAYINAAPAVSSQAAQLGQAGATLFKVAALPAGKEWFFVGAELIGAMIIAMGYASVSREKSRLVAAFGVGGGLFIGLTVGTQLLTYIGGTAAVLNPAVAATVQAISWNLMPIVTYIVAPVVGGILGFGLLDLLRDESE